MSWAEDTVLSGRSCHVPLTVQAVGRLFRSEVGWAEPAAAVTFLIPLDMNESASEES